MGGRRGKGDKGEITSENAAPQTHSYNLEVELLNVCDCDTTATVSALFLGKELDIKRGELRVISLLWEGSNPVQSRIETILKKFH